MYPNGKLFKKVLLRCFMDKKLRILAAADLHGDVDLAKKLSVKAKKGKADLVVLAGDIQGASEGDESILKPFEKAGQKVVFVPGNWESAKEHQAMRDRAKSLHNYYVTYNDVGIAGIGSEDFKLSFDSDDLEAIKGNFERMKPKKRILVSHLHARGTKAEFSGFEGDEILRGAVEKIKPDLLISAHVHEAEGVEDKIGKTKVVQVGRKGKFLEI
jgi:Icc-related predicted phosphoesterase